MFCVPWMASTMLAIQLFIFPFINFAGIHCSNTHKKRAFPLSKHHFFFCLTFHFSLTMLISNCIWASLFFYSISLDFPLSLVLCLSPLEILWMCMNYQSKIFLLLQFCVARGDSGNRFSCTSVSQYFMPLSKWSLNFLLFPLIAHQNRCFQL